MIPSSFPPENEYDNVEYKREIHGNIENKRFTQLSAQMTRRINNGIELYDKPEAVYYVGVNDNGTLTNVSEESINITITVIKSIVASNNYEIKDITINNIGTSIFAKIIIIKNRCSANDTRVLFIGPPCTGKTKTLFALNKDPFIDGSKINKITHSNIFYSSGRQVYYDPESFMSVQGMVLGSDKVTSVTDIPGHKKYFRDTIKSLFSNKFNHVYIFYCIGADIDIVIKYLRITKFLELQYSLVNTGENYLPEELQEDEDNILLINEQKSINNLSKHIYNVQQYYRNISNNVIFTVNNIMINNFGTIIDGIMQEGSIRNGNKLLIGPNSDTEFCQVIIKTIHKKQTPYDSIDQHEDASILITPVNNTFKVTKGMIMFSKNLISNFQNTFYISLDNNLGIKIEKYMKFMVFMSNGYHKISVVEDIFIDSTYHMYLCKLSKDKKRLFADKEKIGLRYGNNIIEAVVSLSI